MNNFWKRALTGAAFVVVLLGATYFHTYSFVVLFLLITVLASLEFYRIVEKSAKGIRLNIVGSVVASAILFLAALCSANLRLVIFTDNYCHFPVDPFLLYGLFVAAMIIYELYRKKENPVHNWAYFLLGQVFVALPFALLNYLVFQRVSPYIPVAQFKPIFLIALFLLIWTADTGAYLVGMVFGKHRLFERISPKKSWEGFFGGAFFALLLGYFLPMITGEMDVIRWVGFALVVVIFGTWGDLIESLLKRTLNIKDSGSMLPGHGGLLDRFDSLLLAAPMIYIYLQFVL